MNPADTTFYARVLSTQSAAPYGSVFDGKRAHGCKLCCTMSRAIFRELDLSIFRTPHRSTLSVRYPDRYRTNTYRLWTTFKPINRHYGAARSVIHALALPHQRTRRRDSCPATQTGADAKADSNPSAAHRSRDFVQEHPACLPARARLPSPLACSRSVGRATSSYGLEHQLAHARRSTSGVPVRGHVRAKGLREI